MSEVSSAAVDDKLPMARRFRGFMPVVIDVECGGFNPNTDALLEIAAVLLEIQGDGSLLPGEGWRYHVQPFPGAKLEAGVARGHGHRSVSSVATGDSRERSVDALVQRHSSRDEGQRLHPRDPGRPQRLLRFELHQRGHRAQRTSSAIRFIRSRASTRRPWPVWLTDKQCSAKHCWPQASSGMPVRHIRRPTMRRRQRSCSARSVTR